MMATSAVEIRPPELSTARLVLAYLITGLATFMAGLDNLVVTTALPAIRASFEVGVSDLTWTVNAYTIAFSVFMLAAAALGDRYGRVLIFTVGIAVFGASSALVALAPTMLWFSLFRAVQGIGAAMIIPLAMTLLIGVVRQKERPIALGILGGINGLAIALGPFVGGWLVHSVDWHVIFWLNVPIAGVLVPLAALSFRGTARVARASIDVPGIVLLSLGLTGLLFGLLRSEHSGWPRADSGGLILLGLALIAAFWQVELRLPAPMLPPRLLGSRGFRLSLATALLTSAGVFGAVFLMTQYLQVVLAYNPLRAGLATLPWTLVPLVAAPAAGILASRVGMKWPLVVGTALQAGALGWFALVLRSDVPYALLLPGLVCAGLGMGVFFALITGQAIFFASSEDEGIASGVGNSVREIGVLLGVTVAATVFAWNDGDSSAAGFTAATPTTLLVTAGVVAAAVITAVRTPNDSPTPLTEESS
ncbi:MFS transporter [Streptomyces sp. 3MP-14]|uniref:MFS transporter n=1 Tax=Streptomyces mimosae TaxID=2586635 RepID=A0A5N6APW5_9ACTN|nr:MULTISPECIES: MFS transporter [Streptomyces]KAB8169739.1 MFS transporter [Streptomyces mimosae]KAB8178487.1 MFS transporter [Streptomyces sp. 3MP-14]